MHRHAAILQYLCTQPDLFGGTIASFRSEAAIEHPLKMGHLLEKNWISVSFENFNNICMIFQ